ncbi:tetratricopeptide repeat protein [Phreatobacter stygius]|uniref:Cell division coordinator CpoB n=2 Tax=Phreatobacter stygius TaxID=1940610 RepID=A0A4D7BH35_9HYPH|nr:tetratricopeptide repeat protein [Phreatobacter stygius]
MWAGLALAAALVVAANGGAQAQSGADLLDRIQRLEAQIRSLNGQLEQSQFRIRQMEDQARRSQADLEFRLNELESQRGGARPSQPRQQPQQPAQPQRQQRGDAFDPNAQQGAVGTPRDLGAVPPGGNAAQPRVGSIGPGGATASTGGGVPMGPAGGGGSDGGAQPLDLGQMSGQAANDPTLDPRDPRMAARPPGTGTQQIIAASPRDEYDQAVALVQRREFEQAEMALRGFIQSHPRDRLVGDATHQLGETMYQRRQYREAAEQFLKVSTDYPRIGRAQSSLLRLGQSLNALGEREAACAAYAEFNRKYPNARPQTKTAVANEQRRASC